MKAFLIAFLIASLLIASQIEAKSFNQNESTTLHKRIFGSWINNAINTVSGAVTGAVNTVVNVVTDNVINPVVGGVNTVINTIGGININDIVNTVVDSVWKPIESTAVDSFNQVVGGINTAVDTVGNIISSLGGSGGGAGPQGEPDFCDLRCKSVDQAGSEFYYDQNHGCVSKGFSSLPYNFNSCCDSHNHCLNTKCCTSECQTMKNECDGDYKRCLRSVCSSLSDFDEMDKCVGLANVVASYANASRCNPNESRYRKLCIC